MSPAINVPISEICLDEHIRDPHDDVINRLMIDMKEKGQFRPVTVYTYDVDQYKYLLVDGLQRIEAAKQLGWKYISIEIREPRFGTKDS